MSTNFLTAFTSPIPLIILLPSLAISYWFLWILYALFFHPLSKFPGPLLARVSRTWLVFQIFGAKTEKTQRALHDKYGPIIRIAPNELAIADPEAVKTIYAINSGFTKTDFYPPFKPDFSKYPDHFTSQDEKIHADRRKIVNNLYSMSNILQSEVYIDICSEMLITRIGEFAETGELVDLSRWIQMYAFDVIGELYFSKMFGFMRDKHDYRGYIASLDALLPILVASAVMPKYARPFFMLGGLFMPSILKALKALKDIDVAAETCVAERLQSLDQGYNPRQDILARLFDIYREKGEKVDFGVVDIKLEAYIAIFAGSDTTAAAISSILYHVMKHPVVRKRLVDEIDEATKSGMLSSPNIRYSEAIRLPYLNACCKEGMRVHPSVGLTLPRHVPKGGCAISGVWFPEGTRVGVNAAVIHFDKTIFGSDAEKFNPDRWFREDAVNMDRYMFQFGAGSRTCIGKNISLCEMYKIISQLFRSYDMELAEPLKEWETHNYWFYKPGKINVTFRKR